MVNRVLEKKISHWKQQLLDLSKRNRMINFKESRLSTLKLTSPDCTELYNRIVTKEEELSFKRVIDRSSNNKVGAIISLFAELNEPITVEIGDIGTNVSFADMQRTLKNLRSKAKLSLEEQGSNILYMCVGFIEWSSNEKNYKTKSVSPLLLVPVTIQMTALNAPYTLKKYEDEVVLNPTLVYLFANELGYELPDFDSDEDSIESYFDKVEKYADKQGWQLIKEVSIGLMSFQKISMYMDIENNIERLKNNPVINALAGDSSMMDYSTVNIPDIDSIHPSDNFEVLSADSSQQEAILCSKQGLSFVMQGPPGTGKSQTIANIISEALADGKKVLFVSEKMAALQVVYRRLQETNLSDFCLPLHSFKANKKEVIDQLGKSLNLPKFELKQEVDSIQESLFSTRNELNEYVRTLHKKIEPIGLSCYEIYVKLVELKDADIIEFDLPDADKIDKSALYMYLRDLERYEEAVINIGFNVKNNPWRDFRNKNVGIEYLNMFSVVLNELHDIYAEMIPLIAELETEYHIDENYFFENYDDIIDDIPKYTGANDVPAEWFKLEEHEKIIEKIQDIKNYSVRIRELLADIEVVFSSEILGKDISSWLESMNSKIETVKRLTDVRNEDILINLSSFTERNKEISMSVSLMKESIEKLAQLCHMTFNNTIEETEKAVRFIDLISKGDRYLNQWFDSERIVNYKELALKFRDYAEIIRKFTNEYGAEWDIGVVNSDNGKLLSKFREKYCTDYLNDTIVQFLNISTEDITVVKEHINELNNEASALIACYKELEDETGINVIPDSETADMIVKLSEILFYDAPLIIEWFAPETDYSELIQAALDAERLFNDLFHIEEEILKDWKREALDLDYDSILHRFEEEYKSVFRFFSSIYREDRRNLRSLTKDEQNKVNDEAIVKLLNQLKERRNISANLDEICVAKKIGNLYSNSETDWDRVRAAIKLAEKIHDLLGNVPKKFCIIICNQAQKEEKLAVLKAIADRIDKKRIRVDEICALCKINSFENYSQLAYNVNAAYQTISEYDIEHERDRAQICRYSRIDERLYSDGYIKSLLEAVYDYREAADAFSNQNEVLCSVFGILYKGSETDWERIISALNDVSEILDIYGTLSDKTISIICSEAEIEELRKTGNDLNSALLKFERNSYYGSGKKIRNCHFDNITEDTVKISNSISDINKLINEIKGYIKYNFNTAEIISVAEKVSDYCKLRTSFLQTIEFIKLYLVGVSFDKTSDWDALICQLKLLKSLKARTLPSEFYNSIASDREKRIRFSEICGRIDSIRPGLNEKLEWVNEQFDDNKDLVKMSYSQSYEFIAQCLQCFDKLEFWLDYICIRQECCETVIKNYICNIEADEKFDHIKNSFLRTFYLKLLDKTFSKEKLLSRFQRNRHENVIDSFRQNDRNQLFAAQAKLCSKLIEQLPDSNSLIRVNDEVSILQKEINKRQKHMPLRKLFKRIPNLLMRLKPCLMMSPLSVSYFLEAESYNFDIVIFDEASQILPEDAIGAILRGKQVIIAGDIKQMPPTSFFSSSIGTAEKDLDDESEEMTDDVLAASILEEAAGTLPSKTLLWHYRSRNESLIAFSNSEIYDNKLITFPDSTIFAKDMGVEYVYVSDGVYEGHGKNCNEREAQQCVRLLEKHIIEHPERSLGIIAFSEKQQGVIQREVDNFRISNPEYEFFFENNSDEPFFVKNLENVQGDERDTIIFSICYAKDINGRLYMRFGPLGHQGGERRLNVAVTRAKCNVKLVGSLLPEELDLNRIKSEGVRLLRKYIEFAIHGQSKLNNKRMISYFDNDGFCDHVAEFIKGSGYDIKRSFGNSDNKIDIAVSDPDDPDSFIAGIECDGYSYRSAKTARDRDSLRYSVLKKMGWNMYRVWSTEWIRNEQAAKKRLLDYLNKAHNRIEDSERIINNDMSRYLVEVEKEQDNDEGSNPYGLAQYIVTPFSSLKPIRNIYDYHTIAEDILCILSFEQPVSMNLLYRRMAYAFGVDKVTVKYRNAVSVAISRELKTKTILDNAQFLWALPKRMPEPKVPLDAESVRKIDDISIEEISELMKIILTKAYGLEPNDLIAECSAVFGYERRGARINTIMNNAIDKLKNDKVIEIVDGKINLIGG